MGLRERHANKNIHKINKKNGKHIGNCAKSINFAVKNQRSDARVAEEARLESVYTPKAYPEFESRSLRSKMESRKQNCLRDFLPYRMIQPTLYIIAGCNGAGKTTASYSVLPDLLECREFVNADEIAKGLSPFNPESVAVVAGKLMLQRINFLLNPKKTFAIETTLATRSYALLIKRAHSLGYQVVLLFFWLASPEMAIERVAKRVSEGGHNIPAETVIRRYWSGLQNFFNIFAPIVDSWMFFDNVDDAILLASDDEVFDEELFNNIRESCLNRKK